MNKPRVFDVGERPPSLNLGDVAHGGLGGSNCGFEGRSNKPRRGFCNVGERRPSLNLGDVAHGGLGGSNCGFEGRMNKPRVFDVGERPPSLNLGDVAAVPIAVLRVE